MQSNESKNLMNKSKVTTTSYSKMEEIDNKKVEVIKKKKILRHPSRAYESWE